MKDELIELLDLAKVIHQPTRQLSLGERMKCELVAALLHQPKVLFLDEPTIGLDVNMQSAVRDFVRDYNQRYGATVMLTSHYMADVAALCPRVIVIDRGKLIHDGELRALIKQIDPKKRISFADSPSLTAAQLEPLGELVSRESGRVVLRVPEREVAGAVAHLLTDLRVADLAIEDAPLEDVMRQLFASETTTDSTGNAAAPSAASTANRQDPTS
jgi:ABC-2 type transport system ATP-binding protein